MWFLLQFVSNVVQSGLKAKDLILKFGSLDHKNNNQLKAIPSVPFNLDSLRKLFFANALRQIVKENEPLVIVVRRDGNRLVKLVLVPHQWTGKGLLGYFTHFNFILSDELTSCLGVTYYLQSERWMEPGDCVK